MKTKIVLDSWSQHDCTLGRLWVDGFQCFTLELPWQNNMRNISCIPEDFYLVTKHKSPNHGDVLKLHDVPNRTHILIHAGNFTRNTQGCILVGDGIKYLDGDTIPDVTNSKKTLTKLLASVPESALLEVMRSQ